MPFRGLVRLLAAGLLLGASVSAAQEADDTLRGLATRIDFYVGTAVYAAHLDTPAYVETLTREFNILTPESDVKTCALEPEQGRFDFTLIDQLVDFAEAHDMQVHGHTLVWHECEPAWLQSGTFSRDQAIDLLRDYVQTVLGHYKGRVLIWDVVNEAINEDGSDLRDSAWRRLIGDDYVELAFRFAREADPAARLYYTDYGAEGINAKSDAVYELMTGFVERGVPIDGVGLQSHFALGTIDAAALAENIRSLGELGLQVQITEADVRYEGPTTEEVLQRQAEDYAALAETCLNSPYCTGITVWGVADGVTWLRDAELGFFNNPTVGPLLFNDNYEPKPAYNALRDALEKRVSMALTSEP